MKSKIIVISGPQSIGKTTLTNFLCEGKTFNYCTLEIDKVKDILKDRFVKVIRFEGDATNGFISELNSICKEIKSEERAPYESKSHVTFIIESQIKPENKIISENVFYFNLG